MDIFTMLQLLHHSDACICASQVNLGVIVLAPMPLSVKH
jgi:hypothetical protein